MNISIHFEGGSAAEIQQQMIALLAGAAIGAGGSPATTETAPSSRRGKKATETVAASAEGNAGAVNSGAPSTGDATSSVGQSSAAGEVTRETLNPRILQLGQKAGPAAAAELFAEFGAKKFSEIPVEKYGALNARLDDLLA